MSTSIISSLAFAGNQLIIYGSISILVVGVFGNLLNIIVFLSLRTFRQNSCAFYLTIMSIANICQLFTGVLSRIMTGIYGSDGTDLSLVYCKFRFFITQIFAVTTLTCFSLVTIDQYCATSPRPRLQQLSSIKVARGLIIIFSLFWILHGILQLVFYNHITKAGTNTVSCGITNSIYQQYRIYITNLTYLGFLPVSITVLFGSMAYYNVRRSAHYTVPLVRRELDKQLTAMVLVQVLINIFVLLPSSITDVIGLSTNINNDPITKAQLQFSSAITLILFYGYYANSFYIYICVSERFRRQLIYVIFRNHLNQLQRQPKVILNQVEPQS